MKTPAVDDKQSWEEKRKTIIGDITKSFHMELNRDIDLYKPLKHCDFGMRKDGNIRNQIVIRIFDKVELSKLQLTKDLP